MLRTRLFEKGHEDSLKLTNGGGRRVFTYTKAGNKPYVCVCVWGEDNKQDDYLGGLEPPYPFHARPLLRPASA